MKKNQNTIWLGVEQIQNSPDYHESTDKEFLELPVIDQITEEALSVETKRRDFLKYLGFGLGAATLAASCDIPVKRAIPYVIKPDAIVPGVATYYASTFVLGGDYCPVLVKTRDGRPIKVEGNSLSSITRGGTSARAQASVLGLYDNSRISGPYRVENGQIQFPKRRGLSGPGWAAIDEEIKGKLNSGSRVRILTNTNMSPSSKKALVAFAAAYPNTKVVTYDAVSSAAILEANAASFGKAVVPSYHFDKAQVIVSFEADFLGTWISPIEFASQYAVNRKIKDVKQARMSRHIQVESHMSLTGSNADNRIMVKPSEQGAAIVALYNAIAAAKGASTVSGPKLDATKQGKLAKVAEELLANEGKALIVSGSNNTGEQILVNAANELLGSYGTTIDLTVPSYQRQGMDKDVQALVKEMNAGGVDALFIMDGANPAWDLPNAGDFAAGMEKVAMKVSFSVLPNETALLCNYVTPTNHFLESWGDVEAKKGKYSLIQPTIAPLFDTRQAEESLLVWSANERDNTSYYDFIRTHWEESIFPEQDRFATFQAFWDNALHDGVFEMEVKEEVSAFQADVAAAASRVRKPASTELEISFFETVNAGAGQYGNNPWLLEMPDPVHRCSWGNYLAIPVAYEGGLDFKALKGLNGNEIKGKADVVEVDIKGQKEACTAVRQFGQMEGTVALALGYGRINTGKLGLALGNKVGVNVYPWLSVDEYGNTQYYATEVNISDKVAAEKEFACVQYHHSMGLKGMDPDSGQEINIDEKVANTLPDPFNEAGFQGGITERSIIYQSNLSDLDELVHHIGEKRAEAEKLNSHTIYPYEEYKEKYYSQGHHWQMHIDLSACIGCGACQVACIAENNVPIVGKREVSRHHEMTWIRIDRYFYGDFENPNVVYQPMMCQHCDNAPCENVCPVAATNHSSEGLNQMTYNRCIGTRYCANNCPYKVRRFNWLDYTTADLFPVNEPTANGEELPFGADNLTRMVLNPDVTVRSRGVIEKCSFCVQRIQEGKLTAKKEGRSLRDEDVKSACQTACPTGAIVFGDGNNPKGQVAAALNSPLNYTVLEEINTRPSVTYSAKIINRNESLDA